MVECVTICVSLINRWFRPALLGLMRVLLCTWALRRAGVWAYLQCPIALFRVRWVLRPL
jgi:hypothetical protein